MRCFDKQSKSEESTYIIYSHAVFISALLSIIAKSRPKRTRDLVFRLDHTSISKISLENYSWKILEVNNTGHLKTHSISRVIVNNIIGGKDTSVVNTDSSENSDANGPEVSNIVGNSDANGPEVINIVGNSDSFDF